MKTILYLLHIILLTLIISSVNGQTATFYENFDVIGTSATATLPGNWRADKQTLVRTVGTYSTAVTVTEQRGGTTMSPSAANGIYNYGDGNATTATNRCVGFLSSSSSTKSGNLYCKFNNAGLVDITAVPLSYNIKKYRNGSNPSGFSIQVYYSFNGSTWTSAGSSFLTSFAADADNNGSATVPITTINVSQDLTVTIPAGSDFYLCWNYSVTSTTTTSNAQALGIDDVTINDVPLPVHLTYFNSKVTENKVTLNWQTVWEINNSGFDIEKKLFDGDWNKIGFVTGSGNTTMPVSYTFFDDRVNTGLYYYRLKQIDFNGNYEYYNLSNDVVIGTPKDLSLDQNYPNPANPSTTISYKLPTDMFVSLKVYDILGREVAVLVNEIKKAGYHNQTFNADNIASGMYFYKLFAGQNNPIVKKMTIVK